MDKVILKKESNKLYSMFMIVNTEPVPVGSLIITSNNTMVVSAIHKAYKHLVVGYFPNAMYAEIN